MLGVRDSLECCDLSPGRKSSGLGCEKMQDMRLKTVAHGCGGYRGLATGWAQGQGLHPGRWVNGTRLVPRPRGGGVQGLWMESTRSRLPTSLQLPFHPTLSTPSQRPERTCAQADPITAPSAASPHSFQAHSEANSNPCTGQPASSPSALRPLL